MRKDWWDRSSIIFTGLLVLIGAIGAGFALRTLLAIERQTVALVEGQRPKIGAEPHGDLTQTLQDINAPRIEMRLLNTGQTVARNLTYETWTELLPLPFKDFGPSADHFESVNPVVLHPQHGPPLVINIAVRITPRQLRELKVSRLHVCFRIRVRYTDAFSPSRCINFGFIVHPRGLGYLPKYNDGDS